MPHSESLKIMNMMDFIRKSNNIRFAVDDEKDMTQTPSIEEAKMQLPEAPVEENTQIQTDTDEATE